MTLILEMQLTLYVIITKRYYFVHYFVKYNATHTMTTYNI